MQGQGKWWASNPRATDRGDGAAIEAPSRLGPIGTASRRPSSQRLLAFDCYGSRGGQGRNARQKSEDSLLHRWIPPMTTMRKLVLFVIFLGPVVASAQTSWKGTLSKDWRLAGNWTAGVPTASVDAIIGDGNFTGANQPDLSASSFCKSLTIGTGTKVCTLKVDKTLTISGNV